MYEKMDQIHGPCIGYRHRSRHSAAGQRCQCPLGGQKAPADNGIHRHKAYQQDRGVGACDQKIDGAVVDDLHDLLAHVGEQTMVYAGHTVQCDHGKAVDR